MTKPCKVGQAKAKQESTTVVQGTKQDPGNLHLLIFRWRHNKREPFLLDEYCLEFLTTIAFSFCHSLPPNHNAGESGESSSFSDFGLCLCVWSMSLVYLCLYACGALGSYFFRLPSSRPCFSHTTLVCGHALFLALPCPYLCRETRRERAQDIRQGGGHHTHTLSRLCDSEA